MEVEAGSLYEEDLDQMTVPVSLYRVADVDVSGNYTELAGFEGIGLADISNETTVDEWLSMAQIVSGKLTDSSEAADIEVINGTDTADGLKVEREMQYGKITINKKLLGYNALAGEGWSSGKDGYWYYSNPVAPKDKTASLLVQITLPEDFNVEIVKECTPVLHDENGNPYAGWNLATNQGGMN